MAAINCAYWNGVGGEWGQALEEALSGYRAVLYPFESFQDLVTIARDNILDAVVIPCNASIHRELALGKRAKAVPALMVVPVILWHPDPSPETADRILNSNIDELVTGLPEDPVARARLRLAIRRSHRDLDVNPSSRLPGPMSIEAVLRDKIAREEHFAVCYADLDDFKAYNDYYGYFYGDRVIKLTARVVREAVFEHQVDGFVGHIGGDDFVFVVHPSKVERICKAVIARFDSEIGDCYDPRDRRNGYIISTNRRSVPESYPLMGLSIAVVINHGNTFQHVGEISHMVADLKKYAKTLPGSNYVIERRSKY